MNIPQTPRRKHGLRVALITDDFVGKRELFQEPEDPLRSGIVQVVDFDQGEWTLARATPSMLRDSRTPGDPDAERGQNDTSERDSQADDQRHVQDVCRVAKSTDRRCAAYSEAE